MINETIDFIKEFYRNDSSGHDFKHSMRVYSTCVEISKNYDVNTELLLVSALLHDIDDHKFNDDYESYKNLRNYLKDKVNENYIEEVISLIDQVSYSKNSGKTTSIEASILRDSDRLDAIGAVGIARTFMYSGSKGKKMEDSIEHFHDKLLKIKDLLETKEAIEIAERRHEFLESFLVEYNLETN